MSYSTGEALIFTLVKACTSFSADNVSRANWKIRNKGTSDHYAILHQQGRPGVKMISPSSYLFTWRTAVEIWQRYKDDSTSQINLYDQTDNVIQGLLPYARLNDSGQNIQNAFVRELSEAQEMWKRGAVEWLRQIVTVEWEEINTVTIVP